MQLNRAGLADKSAWEAKGYALPSFDYETVKKNTKENPFWVHFGVGNIFRAFQCNVVQNLSLIHIFLKKCVCVELCDLHNCLMFTLCTL